ncbi:MAG: SWIM zinc finger family protein [Blastocatellia bacterium]
MAKASLPKLAEAQVRKLANARSFERGLDCYYGGAILDPVRQGMELRAQCEGSDDEPYEVSVTLDEDGVAEGYCSCPYEYDLVCKHIVALLLTYVHEPETFRVVKSPRKALADYSREELIEVIGEILEQNPKVMAAVKRAAKGVKAGNWDEVRADALAELERKGQIGELIEIALDEKDVARALALLPRVKDEGWFYRNYKGQVAHAAEKSHPREAIAIYQQIVERTMPPHAGAVSPGSG